MKELIRGIFNKHKEKDSSIEEFLTDLETSIEKECNTNYVSRNDYMRTIADYENMKKRLVKTNATYMDNWRNQFYEFLIDIIDDFDFALKSEPNNEGLILIKNKMISSLSKYNIEIIRPSKGELFDDSIQECVLTIDGGNKGCVVDCVHNGAVIKDDSGMNVIRYAKVIVEK